MDIRRATATLRRQKMAMAESRRKYAKEMEDFGAFLVLYRGWSVEVLYSLRREWVERESNIRKQYGPDAADRIISLLKMAASDIDRIDAQRLEETIAEIIKRESALPQAA